MDCRVCKNKRAWSVWPFLCKDCRSSIGFEQIIKEKNNIKERIEEQYEDFINMKIEDLMKSFNNENINKRS